MQGFAAATTEEVCRTLNATKKLIKDSMHEAITKAQEESSEVILNEVSKAISLKTFHNFSLDDDSPIGRTLYCLVYGREASCEYDPETVPQQGTIVQLVEGAAGKKAFKVDINESSTDSLHECFSIIYIQSVMESLPKTVTFRFAPLEVAGFYNRAQQRRLFMISECAQGHSVDHYTVDALYESEKLRNFLDVIRHTAVAFAQLHQHTKVELDARKERERILIMSSYSEALREIKMRLANHTWNTYANESEKAITVKFYEFLYLIDQFSERIISEDEKPDAYLRNTTLIHGDANIGNIFCDTVAGLITFVDYSTAIKSFKRDADPLKEIGFFLESVWLKLARNDDLNIEYLYRVAKKAKDKLIHSYMEYKGEDPVFFEKISQRVKLYMWCQLFGYFYSLDAWEETVETIECLKYFLRREFC